MSFDPNIPNAGQSPGLFPAQSNTNYARLKTIINTEHVFNDTAAASDGIHRQMTTVNRADPVTVGAGNAVLYTKSTSGASQLFFYNGVNVQQITPFADLIKAMVNFNGTGATGNKTIRSSKGVSTVNKTATGLYTINFSPTLANDNYVVLFGAMRGSSGERIYPMVEGGSTYSDSITTTFLKLRFVGSSGDRVDALMGSVAILSLL